MMYARYATKSIGLASFLLFLLSTPAALVANDNNNARLRGPAPNDSDFRNGGTVDPVLFELGRALFFDKELSGNRNISCATCHHPFANTADGLSLPVGEGGMGLSVTRDTGTGAEAIVERVPRNSPALFMLGARQFDTLFHDGRVAETDEGFVSPAGPDLPEGLENALAVQAMFPVTSAAEMAGQLGENEIADVVDDLPELWRRLAVRLQNIEGYQEMFSAAFGIPPEEITFVHAANAIAAFEAEAWRADDSPFDRFLRGERQAMSRAATRGMRLFYGKAKCSVCHSGVFQTDHDFHAIAMPQIGPGKGDGIEGREDFGRGRETGNPEDMYAFRTPSLRNVALSGPYGHAGAYATLEGVVRHHLDPVDSLLNYDPSQAVLPSRPDLDDEDLKVMNNPAAVHNIVAANELEPVDLTERQISDIMDFLYALTDPASLDTRGDVPRSVPSGLPIFD